LTFQPKIILKMKKVILTLLVVIFGFWLQAAPVSLETAQNVAVGFYQHYADKSTDYTISDVITKQKDGITTFYIFIFQSGGFVMVAADDAVIPVIGYSVSEPFDVNNIPINAQDWFEQYSDQIKAIIDQQVDNTATKKEWTKILTGQFNDSKLTVNPLCSTLWDQSYPFNNSCPGGSYTGCVATAMAQVMKKWNYPTTGIGSHSYTDATYGVQTVNFASGTYDWANMKDDYSTSTATQRAAVAKLMYHCGVSVNMQYSTSGSGAYSMDVPDALIDHFGYASTAEIKYKSNFTNANWITLLKTELDAGRPIFYSGDDGSSGHAFVFDGYNASSQFHVNWGWSGSSNGYFTVGSLNPSGYTFNLDNAAVIRIHPPSSAPVADFTGSTTTPAVGGTVNYTDLSTGSPTSWTWAFEGGSPASYTGQTPGAVTYSTAGHYQVSLTVSNGSGTDTKTVARYINVGGTPSAWLKQNSGFAKANRGIENIFIVDPNVVWAAAYNGVSSTNPIQEYTKTVNGGTTWTPGSVTFTGSEGYGIANFHAFSDQICYACMFPSAANGGFIVKTIDGGTTWTKQTTADFSTSWADFVYFFNTNDGVCVGDPSTSPNEYMIYTTNNGGTTWSRVASANIPNPATTETAIVNLFDAVGNTIWFGTSGGRVYKSADKGATWTVSASGLGTGVQITPTFKDASTGVVVGISSTTNSYAGMKKTVNGGTSWSTITPTGFFVKYPHFDFIPGTTASWVNVGAGPNNIGSSYSLDDCSTFVNIDTGSVQYTCVTMYDSYTGWAGGFNTSSTDGGIYKWQNPITTGIDNPSSGNSDVRIYPNPTRDIINIEFSIFASEAVQVGVYNIMGEKVFSQDFDPTYDNMLQLDLSGKVPGIYLVVVKDGSSVTTKRISLIR
jgi:PKD repeat protein